MRICSALDERFEENPELRVRFPNAPPANGKESESQITFVKDRLGHDWRYAIDARRISEDLEFQPATTFDQGIDRTLDWYLENEPWWRAVMDQSYREWIDNQYGKS